MVEAIGHHQWTALLRRDVTVSSSTCIIHTVFLFSATYATLVGQRYSLRSINGGRMRHFGASNFSFRCMKDDEEEARTSIVALSLSSVTLPPPAEVTRTHGEDSASVSVKGPSFTEMFPFCNKCALWIAHHGQPSPALPPPQVEHISNSVVLSQAMPDGMGGRPVKPTGRGEQQGLRARMKAGLPATGHGLLVHEKGGAMRGGLDSAWMMGSFLSAI